HRHAVADDVQVRLLEVDDAAAVRRSDVRVPDVPFQRDRPVQHLRAGRHLVAVERDVLADDVEGLPRAVAGDAAADRVEPLDQCVQLFPGPQGFHRWRRSDSSTMPAAPWWRSQASRGNTWLKASLSRPYFR